MECPVCSMTLPDRTQLCPGCKADLSKWRPKTPAVTDAPAVILEQKEVFTVSSLLKTLTPYYGLLGFLVLFCAALYGGYRIYFAYVLRSELDRGPLRPSDAASAQAALPEIRLSTSGFAGLYQEYSAGAGELGVPALEKEAADHFQSGVAEIEAVSSAAVAGTAVTAAEEYLERTFGGTVVEEERAKNEALTRKFSGKKRKPAGEDAALFLETYGVRFRREGALAALERLRRQILPPAEERQPQNR